MEKERKKMRRKSQPARGSGSAKVGGEARQGGNEAPGNLQELLRRAMALGFSGLFTTEATIRSALGDTLPKEWIDFASEQGERTRKDLIDGMAREFGRVVGDLDAAQVLRTLLDGRELEINARFRLVPAGDEASKRTAKRGTTKTAVSMNETKTKRKT